jgi:hypothetical protein
MEYWNKQRTEGKGLRTEKGKDEKTKDKGLQNGK